MKRKILYALFFFVGMNKVYCYLPIISIYLCLTIFDFQKLKIIKVYLLWIFCTFLMLLAIYLFGYDEIQVSNKTNILYLTLFSFIFIGYIYQNCPSVEKEYLLKIYLMGMGLEALAVIIFSYYIDVDYGYGRLLDPFSNSEINSPGIGENIAVLSIIFIYELIRNDSFAVKLGSFTALAILILMGLYLASRTYFIIFFITLMLIIVNEIVNKKNINYLFKYIAGAAIIFILMSRSGIIDKFLSISLERFSTGIESKRFDHYSDGIEKILSHPLGGFSTSPIIEDTPWFHNIFLDVARLGGWLALLPLIIVILYVIYQISKSNFQKVSIAIPLSIGILLIMQQGVVIEGNIRLIVALFLCSICMVKSKNQKNV